MDKSTAPCFVKSMFGAIAPRYDFLNRLLSLRQDVYWRRRLIDALCVPESGCILDAACGTGDVIIEILSRKNTPKVVGIDFSPEMLAIAQKKIAAAPPGRGAFLLAADALDPPFAGESFDAVTIAFGIRNITARQKAMERFREILKPGGMLAVLELATPADERLRRLYLLYFAKILPAIGGLFSKNMRAYRYLPASVLGFPRPAEFAALMRGAGFTDVKWLDLTAGIATLYTGRKK
ncbi:MAG: bifunctional demethylmenaquinone methyltransferase/2-methoxy-6-polyprenyl-1,4-benzoquinol methylase UbiE [Desulfobacteraceae bacterium]|nr:bifunctional demethylmenaquinone methyltransferase/2-methoxy-6-polyprenyl-1,4-benzoquinol methylase UbiE [Desulfobacteraceae bacterium]MCF8094510.1 bifunctional demethylmenaquinone methyltransferase/2-methoxy-6-polyprenyl-1,4-benzoquinol methylase UbiE [Desulfobacteraceae bacterium]